MMTHLFDPLLTLLHAATLVGVESFRVALPDFGGGVGSEMGGVGHLIAAAMQTAGVHAQAEILASFQGFLKQLAALCYLASIIGALVAASMFGDYRRAAYLLIGPPLFFFMVTTTEQVGGGPVQNGERVVPGSVDQQLRFLNDYASKAKFTQAANVSYFFVGFDNLVSSVVQGIVGVIIDTKNSEDLVVKARERVLSWMLLATPSDPAFVKLISLGTMGECAEVLRTKWELRSHRLDPKSDLLTDANLDEIGRKMQQEYQAAVVRPRFELDHEVIALLMSDPKTQSEFRHEKKSCQYLWDQTHRIARAMATNQLDIKKYLAAGGNDDGSVPWDRVQKEVADALGQGADAADVLAAYIVKNAIANTTHASMTSSIFDRTPFNAERRAGIFEEVSETHRYGGFLKVQFFAKTIPYIQGIFLYLLACAFPFYAVFLVMPSRANTFLVWISLWIWVKSWDVGFALVVVARKILWLFVQGGVNRYDPKNVPTGSMANNGIDWSRPESIFSLITANDPLATQNLYYTIVAMLTIGVPFITAHFCLGASNLWDIFSSNISQRGDYYFTRRMKQISRSDYASPAEAAQQGLRGMAQVDAAAAAIKQAQGRGQGQGQGQDDDSKRQQAQKAGDSGAGGGSGQRLQRPSFSSTGAGDDD